MKALLLTLLYILAAIPAASQSINAESDRLLRRLDDLITKKADLHKQREEQACRLKDQIAHAEGYNRVTLYKEVYNLYSHFRTDSAQAYLSLLAATPEVKNDPKERAYACIAQAEIWAIMGFYNEAQAELAKVDRSFLTPAHKDLTLFYYRTQRTLYGWMAAYARLPKNIEGWHRAVDRYRDSIISIESPGLNRDIVAADKATAAGRPEEAVKLLTPYAKTIGEADPDPYLCFTLSEAYSQMDRADLSLHCLILTAIADLSRGKTEYQALPLLAQKLYEEGRVEQAYRYLICAIEDANISKARLRSIEANNIFPIIDRKYKQIEAEGKKQTKMGVAILCAGLLAVIGLLINTYRQVRKLRLLRRSQAETNERLIAAGEEARLAMKNLQETNLKLQETLHALGLTDKIKEEYIARYLDRCRGYIDAISDFRRNALRMLKEHKIEELARELKSEAYFRGEQEKFYRDFDESFLTIFPKFVDRFNDLLQEEARLHPKHENSLSTELRIYALIRLGISDTPRIAHFLNYSVATVYSYRSKIRRQALCPPNDFEAKVAVL